MMERNITLNNGLKMPLVGLGTWQSPDEEVQKAVRTALDVGYRHIDTAYNYRNEEAIGKVLEEYMKNGKVKREELFITTKLPMIHMDPQNVRRSLESSLKRLRLSYLDLYLIHTPIAFKFVDDDNLFPKGENGKCMYAKTDLVATWRVMEELVGEGKIKSIGVSNFNSKQMDLIVRNSKVKPVTNQVECNAYFPQKRLQEFCDKHNVLLTAYAPIGSPGKPGHLKKSEIPSLLEDPCITELAKKYKKTPAQILLRNLVQRRIMAIPKSVNPGRITENFQVFDFQLSESEMRKIAELKDYGRLFIFVGLDDHPEYPFLIPY